MHLHNLRHDGEAKTGSLGLPTFAAPKPIEDQLPISHRDTGPSICDAYFPVRMSGHIYLSVDR